MSEIGQDRARHNLPGFHQVYQALGELQLVDRDGPGDVTRRRPRRGSEEGEQDRISLSFSALIKIAQAWKAQVAEKHDSARRIVAKAGPSGTRLSGHDGE